EALNILENYDFSDVEINSPEYIHRFSEAFKLCFRDRSAYMADTAFAEVPLKGLTSKDYAKTLFEQITDKSGSYVAGDPLPYESSSTTSFSVVDEEGNMVACTQTINDFYGNKVAIPGYGFIMNDEMDDFASDPESVNCVAGGKRPLSSMSPSIVLYPDGTPFLTIGTPGGLRIWPTITQIVERMIDYDMDVQEAIDIARIFDNNSETVNYESKDAPMAVTEETVKALEEMGHVTNDRGSWNLFFGGVQGIEILKDGTIRGGADPRRDGKALAY
ncbi:MAG: gamma-glutamyltransferase, partial [Lachnospiraceae bacterium]|nr:gamma-glutamyltransferase [Lachnospiraceae bacterium]